MTRNYDKKADILAYTLLLSPLGTSQPVKEFAIIKSRADQLDDSYDYIIVGGGTSGLTVADRLTEDGTRTVLVIEYGPLESNPDILVPATRLTNFPADMYNYTSIPQPGMNNQTAVIRGGALVGGGSAVNSMFFDRGSVQNYDNWEKLGNPGWGWEGLLPYFKKSVTFTPPSIELQTKFNITYNMDAYGNGPVQASIPPFQWPTATHYDPYAIRANYHLLTGYHANQSLFSPVLTARGIEMQPRNNKGVTRNVTSIFARNEVILAAGAIGTPLILQRSGIGPREILQEAGIEVKVDLPGVRQNLQDHSVIINGYNFTTEPIPNQGMLTSNASFMAEALKEYHENNIGPITGADGNAGAFLPLNIISQNYKSSIDSARAQPASKYLPSTYDATLIAGFEAQKKLLLDSYTSDTTAVIEVPLITKYDNASILLKPLRRGSININTSNPSAGPVINLGVLTNPVDLKINLEAYSSGYMASLGPIETSPGVDVVSDEAIIAWIHESVLPSATHPCGTAAMMAREVGGVGSDLLVHGVGGLSVVDASVMPLIPGTHFSATVYAAAEKAADIIKERPSHDD